MTEVAPIDVWNIETFDSELTEILKGCAELIRNYLTVDRAHMVEILKGKSAYDLPNNPYGREFHRFQESLIPVMENRTIRAWHYTRLSDFEVARLTREGVEISTPESLRARLHAQVAAGHLTEAQMETLYAKSRIHSKEKRAGTFWLAAGPLSILDSGVKYLLGYWGGEVVTMGFRDDAMKFLSEFGQARVLEIAVPLRITNHSYSAAINVVNCYGRSLGCQSEPLGFDVYITESLPASAILAIHSEGDASFIGLADSYPIGVNSGWDGC